MWVRAQIDYLQRLPSDIEKQRALEHLPPDLPQTYIRIFETMESIYPKPTKILIQRLLKWLVLSVEFGKNDSIFYTGRFPLTIATLCQGICIENEHDWPSGETIPTSEHIFRWLGCLIRKPEDDGSIQFSHFTVREFLTMNPKEILSSNIHEYLVNLTDNEFFEICFRCLTHDHFKNTVLHDMEETVSFLSENPLYAYFAIRVRNILGSLDDDETEIKLERLVHRFLFSSSNTFVDLCFTCIFVQVSIIEGHRSDKIRYTIPNLLRKLSSPLQIVSYAGSANQVERLLKEGVDPNPPNTIPVAHLTSLHLAIASGSLPYLDIFRSRIVLRTTGKDEHARAIKQQVRGLRVSKSLLAFGANIEQQVLLKIEYGGGAKGSWSDMAMLTPLVLAIICRNYKIASLLLSRGADWNAIADPSRVYRYDLCSIGNLLARMPVFEHMVERVVEISGHCGVKEALEQWRALRNPKRSGGVKEANGLPSGDEGEELTTRLKALNT